MYDLPSYFQTNSEAMVSRLFFFIGIKETVFWTDFQSHVYHCNRPISRNCLLFQDLRSQELSSSVQSLEKRQEDILCELSGLKAAVEKMASSLGVSLPRQRAKVRSERMLLQGFHRNSSCIQVICSYLMNFFRNIVFFGEEITRNLVWSMDDYTVIYFLSLLNY